MHCDIQIYILRWFHLVYLKGTDETESFYPTSFAIKPRYGEHVPFAIQVAKHWLYN